MHTTPPLHFHCSTEQLDRWVAAIDSGHPLIGDESAFQDPDDLASYDPADLGDLTDSDPLDAVIYDLRRSGVILPPVWYPAAELSVVTADADGYRQVSVLPGPGMPWIGAHLHKGWGFADRHQRGTAALRQAITTTLDLANSAMNDAVTLAADLIRKTSNPTRPIAASTTAGKDKAPTKTAGPSPPPRRGGLGAAGNSTTSRTRGARPAGVGNAQNRA